MNKKNLETKEFHYQTIYIGSTNHLIINHFNNIVLFQKIGQNHNNKLYIGNDVRIISYEFIVIRL